MSGLGAARFSRAAAAAAIALTVGAGMLQISDPLRLTSLTLLAALALQGWGGWRPTWVDAAVGAAWVYGLAQCLTAVNVLPAIALAGMQTSAVMAYVLCRRGGHRAVASGVALAGAVTAALVIGSFAVFRRAATGAGFGSVYDFRFLFKPMGMHCNLIASAMILASGIALMALPRRRKWLRIAAAALMWMAAALTLSRGALIAMGVMWTGLMIALRPLRLKLAAGGALLGAIGMVAAWCPAEMAVALRMTATQSQRLSAQSRIDAAAVSAEAFAERPALGYGPGNYSLAVDRFSPDDTSTAYSIIPPNALSEIAVEQGAVGLTLYAALTVAVIATAWRRRRNRDALTGLAVLTALAVKEMTQCSLWGSSGTMIMAAIVIALMQSPVGKSELHSAAGRLAGILFWIVAAAVTGLTAAMGCGWVHPGRSGVEFLRSGLEAIDDYRRTGSRESLGAACAALDSAIRVMPEERIAGNMLAEALWLRDADPQPITTAAARAPRNHSLQLLAARARIAAGDTTGSITVLAAAIRVMPRLMLTAWPDSLLRSPGVGPLLRTALTAVSPDSTAADKARYGFILYHLGLHAESRRYLLQAVEEMPSLATPWRLLGEIAAERGDLARAADCRRRYNFITFGAFTTRPDTLAAPVIPADSTLLWLQERSRLRSRYSL